MPFNQNLRYVHPEGCDTNDGLTWLSAKRTILSAYDSLPVDPADERWGGTIYFASGSRITREEEPGGLWLTSSATLPSPRWRYAKRFTLCGVGGDTQTSVPPGIPAARLVGYDVSQPLIWIYETEAAIRFENIAAGLVVYGIRLGIPPEGVDADKPRHTVAHASFHNVQLMESDRDDAYGPCVEIGGTSFWLWFTHCYFTGNRAALDDRDNRAAILVRDGYDIYIENCNFTDGGFKYYGRQEGWSFSIRNCTFEIPPPHAIHVVNGNDYGRGYIEGIELADSAGPHSTIRIEGAPPDAITIFNVYPGLIEGAATVLNRYPNIYQLQVSTPSRERQVGFWQGRVAAQHDSARRSFAPAVVRFANLAIQNTAQWARLTFPFDSHNVAISDGRDASPDGTKQAGRIKSTALPSDREGWLTVGAQSGPLSATEYIVAGVWVREVEHPPVHSDNNGTALQVNLKDTGARFANGQSEFMVAPPILGDGEWEWIAGYSIVTTLDSSPLCRIEFQLKCHDGGRVRDFYAPIFLRIPADQISPNEAAELVQHLSTWPPGTPAGCVTTLQGQKLIAQSGLGIGNAEPVGDDADHDLFVDTNVRSRMPIFDSHGDLLGYIPVYRDH